MFDVNDPGTLKSLRKWWSEFKEKAPLEEEHVDDYCCVVVGNKIDVQSASRVPEADAQALLDELVPPPPIAVEPPSPASPSQTPTIPLPQASKAIPVASASSSYSPRHSLTKSSTRSPSRFYGTATSTRTNLTVYHTPSSSLYESYFSARSSPEPGPSTSVSSTSSFRGRTSRSSALSPSSRSSSSGATVTPSLFAREHPSPAVSTLPDLEDHSASTVSPPERGPRLFYASAKTGEGVADIFEYIAQRVIKRWAWEEHVEAQTLHYRETSGGESVLLGSVPENNSGRNCCS